MEERYLNAVIEGVSKELGERVMKFAKVTKEEEGDLTKMTFEILINKF